MKRNASGMVVPVLLVTALALHARTAQADSGLFYFGVGVTSNHVSSIGVAGLDNYFPNINSTSWKLFAGIRPIRPFAVEADYLDMGSQANTFNTPGSCGLTGCSVSWKSDAKAFAIYALGFLPIPTPYLDVFGKAGLASYRLNRTITGDSDYNGGGTPLGSSAYPDNSTVFAWGAGIQAHIGMLGGRLEYEGFNKASTSVYSLSVFVNF